MTHNSKTPIKLVRRGDGHVVFA